MRIHRHWEGVAAADRGASVALGNFDGVHLGHQAVIALARRPGKALGIVTFEPHPRAFFAPGAPPFRLMNAAARAHRLRKLGVDVLYELPFGPALAALSPEEFVSEVLVGGLAVAHVVVGADFRFGKARAGGAEDLERLGKRLGFAVTVADLVETGGQEVSSTAIRAALSAGDPGAARTMLGHWHRIEGPVIHGEKRGRTLGFPTANMDLSGLHLPRFGVYAVSVDVLDGPHRGSFAGVASLGVRPMFGNNRPNIETMLFDFSGDLYGATLSVALIAFLRPEAAFDSVPALVAQMHADCAEARGILADLDEPSKPLSFP
jgi:riboflavin kinase/FMN adenylyltransferase